jgi:3-deoxy-manno-octulosonate cytidylyltransferase (CMP-KDO synthetase)
MGSINNILIIIPARYQSTRLPGKPLLQLGNKTMLQHVCAVAIKAAAKISNVSVLVATDHQKIFDHAHEIGVSAVMTPEDCPSGTDRIIAAVAQLKDIPTAVINLQGDAPLTPVNVIESLINSLRIHTSKAVVTPIKQLNWEQLDILRANKISNPFSGTTVTFNKANEALWFSKQIIPAIRNEAELRSRSENSPIYQHLGLYGYTYDMLEVISKLPKGNYEQLEGLEQLRLLENGYKIITVPVLLDNLDAWRGVDTPDDAKFVTELLNKK